VKYHFKFEKILDVKNREKEEALSTYQRSLQAFENVAKELYSLLKKKEDLEALQAQKIISGLSVQEIRHNQHFLAEIEKSISYYQQLLIKARNRLNWNQQQLQEKNIEVKKFEKIKDKDYQSFLQDIRTQEEKQMDEISNLQFFRNVRS